MNYYVIQVVTGKEEIVKNSLPDLLINPQRKLIIRRKGKNLTEVKPIFPGYLFIKTDITPNIITTLKNSKHIIKILNSYQEPTPLTKTELEFLLPLLNPNFKPEISNIRFNKDDKIVVINGPLKDLEGKIIKVDKRKQRATVQIELYDKIHKINFSYIDISK